MRPSAAFAAILMVLAGCANDGPDVAHDEEPTPIGSLRGVVVDDTVTPIAGATVRAEPGGIEQVADRNGSVVFHDLQPGAYTLTATADGYLETTLVAHVLPDRESPVAKIVLYFDIEQLAYFTPYYFQGYFECGGGVDDITCTNVNIITWIILGIGNVTTDRSLFLQWIERPPTSLQTELVWQSTQQLGDKLTFAVGGATEEQLSTGMATTHNFTYGISPLMLTVPQPELGESGIGRDRALLTQVLPAPYQDIPGGCVVYDPCGPGLQLMQPFETFTHAFYGFEPAPGWRFTEQGAPVPP